MEGCISNFTGRMVGARGFEPPTPWSRTRCATRLRYAPNVCCGEMSMRVLSLRLKRGWACWIAYRLRVSLADYCGSVVEAQREGVLRCFVRCESGIVSAAVRC